MATTETDTQADSLAGPAVHSEWNRTYHTSRNEVFYEETFDRILELIDPPTGAEFLDAGCGPCYHAMRLARRGYRVNAVDFSESVVRQSRMTVAEAGVADRIDVNQGSILALNLPSASIRYVLCWGVLMHIPDVRRAVAELARVTAPDGWLVLSEANSRSFDDLLLRAIARLRRRTPAPRRSPGVESWWESPAGSVLTRHADISWLEAEFASHGMILEHRLPGQFTELYTHRRLAPFAPVLTWCNEIWARYVTSPLGSLGTIMLFKKVRAHSTPAS